MTQYDDRATFNQLDMELITLLSKVKFWEIDPQLYLPVDFSNSKSEELVKTRSEEKKPAPGNGESVPAPNQYELISATEDEFQLTVEPVEDISFSNVDELLKSVTEAIKDKSF